MVLTKRARPSVFFVLVNNTYSHTLYTYRYIYIIKVCVCVYTLYTRIRRINIVTWYTGWLGYDTGGGVTIFSNTLSGVRTAKFNLKARQ